MSVTEGSVTTQGKESRKNLQLNDLATGATGEADNARMETRKTFGKRWDRH